MSEDKAPATPSESDPALAAPNVEITTPATAPSATEDSRTAESAVLASAAEPTTTGASADSTVGSKEPAELTAAPESVPTAAPAAAPTIAPTVEPTAATSIRADAAPAAAVKPESAGPESVRPVPARPPRGGEAPTLGHPAGVPPPSEPVRPSSTAAPTSGARGATTAPAPAREDIGDLIVSDFRGQVSPEDPLGAFKDPHSTMIAGIEESVGYVPMWCLMLMILAVALAMIMWYPTVY